MPHPTSFLHNGPINSPELHSPCAVIDCFAILSSIFSSSCNWLFKHLHAHIDIFLVVYKTNFHIVYHNNDADKKLCLSHFTDGI